MLSRRQLLEQYLTLCLAKPLSAGDRGSTASRAGRSRKALPHAQGGLGSDAWLQSGWMPESKGIL
ncbi:MAG TPA: hypothetical protein VMZ52_02575 [Bryobacteraceae bacterium]|nr:hypothetical protein [Bryobacteraceae bacterium]